MSIIYRSKQKKEIKVLPLDKIAEKEMYKEKPIKLVSKNKKKKETYKDIERRIGVIKYKGKT